jgi:hypothetical protein
MSAVRIRCHHTAHILGIAVAVPFLILAGWSAVEGWYQPDLDDRNEFYGVALFAPIAAIIGFGLARAVGWFLAELVG